MTQFTQNQLNALHNLLRELINQEKAQVLIPAQQPEPGFWFGGGKLAADRNGVIWLSGRYRSAGDSRTGLEAGVRGALCCIFRSDDGGASFTKVQCWTKAEFSTKNYQVISIEGTALHQRADGEWELFISIEKNLPYPEEVLHYQKPGTGLWTIDRLSGSSPDDLQVSTLEPVLEDSEYPAYLHVKDPVVYDAQDGATIMIYCSHPYCWTSSNSGYALREPGASSFKRINNQMAPRGATWDVAVTRITSRLPVPQLGCFAEDEPASIYFYDGAECVRTHPENTRAYKRPRGYSCEEIGGAFVGWEPAFPVLERLSTVEPLFISPWGTGSSRYTDCLVTDMGILAIWQQSQKDGSQPLVRHFLPMDDVDRILSGS